MTEPLRIYLEEIEQIPRLTSEEEMELGKRIAAGDLSAVQKLEEASLYLVLSVAEQYADKGMPLMDLIQEGNIGLMRAAAGFDYTSVPDFTTYASAIIAEEMQMAVEAQTAEIKIPVEMAESLQKVQRLSRELAAELGRAATAAEIAVRADQLTEEEAENLLVLLNDPATLENLEEAFAEQEAAEAEAEGDNKGEAGGEPDAGDDADDSALEEEAGAEAAIAALVQKEEIQELLSCLSGRELQVIQLRFGLEDRKIRTLDETARVMDISAAEAGEIEERAMKKLKKTAGVSK